MSRSIRSVIPNHVAGWFHAFSRIKNLGCYLIFIKLLKRVVGVLPTPFWRAYLKWVPYASGKRLLLERIVAPYYQAHPQAFTVCTTFGSRMVGHTDDLIQRTLYFHGIWEPALTALVTRRLQPGDTFIDVGANIGYYSLLASRLVGATGNVVAIEPSSRIFKILKTNVELNQSTNIRTVRMAVSDRREARRMYSGPASNLGLSTTHVHIEQLNDAEINDLDKIYVPVKEFQYEGEVEAAPLGDIVSESEIRTARIIKIDCEGAEWAVSTGMISLLPLARRDLEIIIELVPEYLAVQGKTAEDVLAIFFEAGFYAYRLEPGYNIDDYLHKPPLKPIVRLSLPVKQEMDVVLSYQNVSALAV